MLKPVLFQDTTPLPEGEFAKIQVLAERYARESSLIERMQMLPHWRVGLKLLGFFFSLYKTRIQLIKSEKYRKSQLGRNPNKPLELIESLQGSKFPSGFDVVTQTQQKP